MPERLVPPSMVEWGAIPPCLETLTSEDYWIAVVVGDENDDDENDNDGGGGGSSPLLTRTVVTVLPEVGCGIDNLEVTRRSEDLSSHVFRRLVGWRSSSAPPAARDDDEGCRGGGIRRTERRNQEVAVVDRGSGTTYEVETIFQVDDDTDEREEENDGDDDDYDGTTTTTTTTTTTMTRHRRIRVSLSLVIPERRTEEDRRGGGGIAIKPSNLIDLRVERRVSSRSTRGTAWTGPAHDSGGLDARTVSRTIGESITHGDVFATTKTKGNDVGRDPWTLFPVIPAGGTYEDGDGREKTTDLLGGAWMRTAIFPPPAGDDDDVGAGVLTTRTESDFAPGGTPSVVALRLPQNVMIRYGTGISSPDDGTTWSIEISHFGVATIGDDGGPTGVRRRVVLRSFDLTMSRNNTTEGKRCGSNNGLGNIHYWVEDKVSFGSPDLRQCGMQSMGATRTC